MGDVQQYAHRREEAAAGRRMTRRGRVAVTWALAGVLLLFGEAVIALGGRGIATIQGGLGAGEWLAFVLLTAAFVYGEGVRALERRWVPFCIGRIAELRADARGIDVTLAPLYAMGLVGARRALLARAWVGVALILLAVLIVRVLPEPWRGIVDFAVAAALAWGTVALVRQAWARLRIGPT